MEVAGRWRREWAGAAEYGKVSRDGVVVRTARALEVMQASAPGARMRVTRSAFHEQGPLSTTFLLHSSTRTIVSSGADILLSPSLVSKPLELSSMPLDTASDGCPDGEEPYRVTEPDDTDISEPSKWRSPTGHRMPSEESSSTDNASLVDASGKSYFASTDARSSFRRKPTGIPLMKIAEHAKCLESNVSKPRASKTRDEWHDRRNSYGFEDKHPNDAKSLSQEDKVGMESSTDSGICKSSEIVNIPIDKYKPYVVGQVDELRTTEEERQETFQDWLAKNRSMTSSKTNFTSTRKNTRDSKLSSSGIHLKSLGKISIALPPSSDRDSDDIKDNKKNTDWESSDNSDKRFKKVGFSKTELHFTADSGKVKIIETDEKPPPTNDFRKRRSAFEPIQERFDKPITLFGGGTFLSEKRFDKLRFDNQENGDIEKLKIDLDNDSAMKSILKNKIPKPKPYLLGEEGELGLRRTSEDSTCRLDMRRTSEDTVDTDVIKSHTSVLNESLREGTRYTKKHPLEHQFKIITETPANGHHTNVASWERKSSPVDYVNLSDVREEFKPLKIVASTQTTNEYFFNMPIQETTRRSEQENKGLINDHNTTSNVHEKLKLLQLSPVPQNRVTTRHLRQNELSYFGVTTNSSDKNMTNSSSLTGTTQGPLEQVLRKRKISNRAAKDPPLYQNLPVQAPVAPMTAPRPSTRKHEQESHSKRPSHSTSTTKKHSSTELENEDKQQPVNTRKSTRLLETISESKVQQSNGIRGTSHRSSKVEGKRNSSSPSPIITVETPSRRSKSLTRSSSRELVSRSRDSSLEDSARPVAVQSRRCRKVAQGSEDIAPSKTSPKAENQAARMNKVAEKNEESRHSDVEQKIKKSTTISSKTQEGNSDKRSKDNQKNYSNEKRSESRKDNKNSVQHFSKDKPNDSTQVNEKHSTTKTRTQRKPDEKSCKPKSRKKEYILNYDDKNGTLSSISREQTKQKKHDKTGGLLEKNEERPKEKVRSSRVTTMELKNPMIALHEHRGRTRSADHKSARRKPREESSN